ncbi:hypothetical protein GALMADRAFT_803744 [Galerina marginata CBS 339.88]|uniref:Uncharacterized protein n=1 Tax=Galerina marginata (strain CBS 339.88) TaxID=685588 RepID=A0A067SJK4_GALM3|nr:hypothetical protein GALMADRAFT_803744 [Galerina marginata CBS 339.88]
MGNILTTLSCNIASDSRFIGGGIALLDTTMTSLIGRMSYLHHSLKKLWAYYVLRVFSIDLRLLARIRDAMPHYLRRLGKRASRDTTMTPEMEEKYWKRAERGQRELERSDARYIDSSGIPVLDRTPQLPPLVMYYTPALPPTKQERLKKQKPYYLSARSYCKWHRMVFPGSDHPTISQASRLRKMHDPEELRKIHRISRMIPDDQVFRPRNAEPIPWSPRYQRKWLKWRVKRREVLETL